MKAPLTTPRHARSGVRLPPTAADAVPPPPDRGPDPGDPSRPGRREYLRALGPGLVTGASDDDPSGIATYAQAGGRYGFGLLWTTFVTFPLMVSVAQICDRTALATGQGLGELLRGRFGRWGRAVMILLLSALLVANAANIAADLLAIGAGMHLLHAGPIWLWALVAGLVTTGLAVSGSYEVTARVLKYLCASLLVYVAVLGFAHVPWGTVASHTLVPHVEPTREYLALVVAILGTTISPYLFFWQSADRIGELEDEDRGGPRAVPLRHRPRSEAGAKKRLSRFDVLAGSSLSQGVMFAIIVATASTVGRDHPVTISSASQAAEALRPVAGSLSSTLFALGFIGTGLLAVPVLAASASAGLSGLLGREWGLSRDVREAPLFYLLVAVGTLAGTALSLVGFSPIRLLVLVALVNGIAAGPFLIAVMLVATSRTIMGPDRPGRVLVALGWTTAVLMSVSAAAVVVLG